MSGSNRKTDSNFTGLRYAEEVTDCIGVLPGQTDPISGTTFAGTPLWLPMQPNSYGDFGAQITTLARTPIQAGRQREKGVVSDLDAAVNFQVDWTQDNLYDLLQGFFFADWRAQATPLSDAPDIAVADADTFSGTGIDADFDDGDVVFVEGFTDPANNGAFIIASTAVGDEITVTSLAGAAPALVAEVNNANVVIRKVGVEFSADDIDVDVSGSFPTLTSVVFDFTTLGIVAGQWIYIGGDVAGSSFTNAQNNGFARVYSVATNAIQLDKTQNTMVAEASAGVSLQVFIGDLIRNENDPALIKTRSYGFERSLSTAGYEYVKGSVGNTLTLNVASADKITADLGFVSTDGFASEKRLTVGAADELNPTAGELTAAASQYPADTSSTSAFNTSSDFSRIRTARQGVATTPLFSFITDLTLTINNNVTPAKAVGTLGAFDVNIGDFVAEGSITAYFSDVAAIQAVRGNADVTVDFAIARNNAGWVFDVPLLTLGEGRLNVTKDEPITIPVSISGARDPHLNTTLQAIYFEYLPTGAEG